MAQADQPPAAPHVWIADGCYAAGDGTSWRWYLEWLPDDVTLQTLQGWIGSDLITVQAEVEAAC